MMKKVRGKCDKRNQMNYERARKGKFKISFDMKLIFTLTFLLTPSLIHFYHQRSFSGNPIEVPVVDPPVQEEVSIY